MQNRNVVITRGQVGQIANLIGGFGLLTALLGFLWQGGITPIIVIIAVIGVGGLAVWTLMVPQEVADLISGRQVKRGTFAVFTTLLLIGIVSVSYIIVQRASIVADITIDNRFSLDSRTLDILQAVKRSTRPIRILGFYGAQDLLQREIDDQYWQLYEANAGGRLTHQYVDPIKEPGLAVPYEYALQEGYYLFVGFVNDDGAIDFDTVTPVNSNNTQEKDMTEAIARLLTAGNFKVYFEQSMGTLDASDNSQQGMSILNNTLRASGIITDRLSLEELASTNSPIPQDASALILARPQREPSQQELALLDAYLQRGGSLFIAADYSPRPDDFMVEGSTFNNYLWEKYGIRMTNAVVVDTQAKGPTELDVISAQVFSDNAIASNLNLENKPETGAIFHLIRAIDVNVEPPVPNGSVVMSSDLSWGETDTQAIIERNEFNADETTDLRGPLTLVAYAYDEDTNGKIVLVGDSDFLTNGYTSAETQYYATGNSTLFLDSIGWLTGFTQQVAFTPQGFSTTPVLFSGGQQLDIIAFITIILMPGSMLVMAIWVYIRKYRVGHQQS